MPTAHSTSPPDSRTGNAMQLSQRVRQLKPSATLAVTAGVKALRDQGVDVIGFGVGEPDFDTPDAIKDAAIAALRDGQTHYMPVAGDPAARKAIADKLNGENNIRCTANDIVISAGAKHSMYLILQCLLDPGRGQEVILLTPAWVSYRPMVELAGGEVVEVPASIDRDFKVTPQQLEDAITSQSAAVIINSPSNPCGTMYARAELEALAEVLARHPHVTVITDEIYEKLTYGDAEHFSIGSIDAIADRVVTVNGLSKAYAMTGWRIGYACAPGERGMLATAMTKLQGQMTSNITSFCYAAIIEALAHGADAVEQMRRTFAERAALMHARLAAIPDVQCPELTGAFYAFPDIGAYLRRTSPGGRSITTSIDFAEALLDEAHVAVVPGEEFGEAGSRHIRLSFACSTDAIETGCQRMHDWLTSFA